MEKELLGNMTNPYYFIRGKLKIRFKINREGQIINHANSILFIVPISPDFGIETRYKNKIMKELATIYTRIINQYKFKNQILFSGSFYKNNEEGQRSDEIELLNNLNFNRNLTETDINGFDVKSQLEHQSQIQETTESG